MDCNICKFNNNCEPKTKALWIYGEGRDILGCNMGEPVTGLWLYVGYLYWKRRNEGRKV